MSTEHEVKFLGRDKSRADHLANAQATIIGAHKLVERARTGDPAEAVANISCAAFWLKLAAKELDELLQQGKD